MPSTIIAQIEVKSDGNLYTNQNSIFLRNDASYTFAKFYFSSSIDYSYAYIYGDFGLNKGHWTGGIISNMEYIDGHYMASMTTMCKYKGKKVTNKITEK